MKRGVNTLIATVLIIGFVVTISIFILIWNFKFSSTIIAGSEKEYVKALSCLNIDFNIINACSKESSIEVILENKKGHDLTGGFFARVYSNNKVEGIPIFPYPVLEAYSTQKLIIYPSIQSPDKLDIIPRLKIDNKITYCNEALKHTSVIKCKK